MLTKTKKTKPSKFIRIFLRSIFILFIILLSFYILGSLSLWKVNSKMTYQNSSDYEFKQNSLTRLVTIKKDGKTIHRFFFYHFVLAAWIDETRPFVFLVTSDTGDLNGAHGLYIYNGDETKKVYQSRTIEFESGEKSPAGLYPTWVYPDKLKKDYENYIRSKSEEMDNRFFNISPDGRYLFGYESGYEGGAGFVIDLPTLTKIDLDFDGSDNLFWSPDRKCAVNYVYGYGYHSLEMAYYQDSDLKIKSYNKSFMPDEFAGVYWVDSCTSVVAVESDSDTNYFKYYKLTKDIDEPVLISKPNISKLKKGEEFEWPLKNIFFTLKAPEKK